MSNSYHPNYQDYPFKSNFFECEGARMHFIDEGTGPVLLFVHGTPTWSYDFREVITALRSQYRCLAIDHIGFGLSDKPEKFNYSTQAHAKRLHQWIEMLDLTHVTLVLHDFGGPIGWQAALYAPHRISALVLMNTWLRSSEGEPDYEKMKRVLKSPLLPFLYRFLNVSPRFLLPASFGENKISRKELRNYLAPFNKRSERSGPLAFALSLWKDQQWFENLWEQRALLNHARKLIIWGEKDPVLKISYLERLKNSITDAEATTLKGCGHFPQVEQPQKMAELIKHWLNR